MLKIKLAIVWTQIMLFILGLNIAKRKDIVSVIFVNIISILIILLMGLCLSL